MPRPIDTDDFSLDMRARGIDVPERAVRITRLTGSQQEHDLTEPTNCRGFGRIRHFRRTTSQGWPSNPLPIEPAARALGIPGAPVTLNAQVFQNAVCNWRCWYCYVDFELLSGRADRSEPLTAEQLVELYLDESQPPPMIDLSGGQPDLVPEWVAWMMGALRDRGVAERVYVWSDDNLSTDYYFSRLTAVQRATIEGYSRYGKVACFKGFDAASFAMNTRAREQDFDRQFELMRRLIVETPLDLYAYATFTGPDDHNVGAAMTRFVDRLQEIAVDLPLRTVPLEVGITYKPVEGRRPLQTMKRALAVQEAAIAAWTTELEQRFGSAEREGSICDVDLRR
jgi:organic radical activating enzyme